jgi:hypothetical protein
LFIVIVVGVPDVPYISKYFPQKKPLSGLRLPADVFTPDNFEWVNLAFDWGKVVH